MEDTTYKRSVKIGDNTLSVYLIKDYRTRRPEFDETWGIEIVVNDTDYYFGGAYGDDALALAALRGVCAMFAVMQELDGQEQDVDLTYFVRTWVAPHNEINGEWDILPDVPDSAPVDEGPELVELLGSNIAQVVKGTKFFK